jgi:hypothetical protein
MRYASIAAAAALSFSLFAMPAVVSAAEEASAATCQSMDAQVRSALSGSQQSSNQQEAVKERDTGRQYCTHGFYKVGMDHYAEALKLLGAKA